MIIEKTQHPVSESFDTNAEYRENYSKGFARGKRFANEVSRCAWVERDTKNVTFANLYSQDQHEDDTLVDFAPTKPIVAIGHEAVDAIALLSVFGEHVA